MDRRQTLYIFLAVVCTILAGTLIAVISGAVRNAMSKGPQHESHSPDGHVSIAPTPQTTGTKKILSNVHRTGIAEITTQRTSQVRTTAVPVQTKVVPVQTHHVNHHAKIGKTTKDWKVILNNTGAEACVRTPDIDGDGLPDVLYGVAHGVDLSTANTLDEINGMKKYCEKKNLPYPCIGYLIALRGYDGKELWRVSTRSEVMFLMCDLDLNGDGVKDCIATGRQSTIQAVDLIKGMTIWYADGSEYPNFFQQTWNVYQGTPLPDVDGDNIADIVVPHGGDPNIDSKIQDRVAGRLIVLSGATGRPLGNYMEMPNDRETYMSTVMYTDYDGSQYLLFGSGGETVSGDLMAITLQDLLEVTNQEHKLQLPGKYRWKEAQPEDKIMVLYKGKTKGIMVPPVVVDVDHDEVDDLIVSAFDGSLVMLDGNTLFPVWTAEFPDMESYSTPAPGYYDDDEFLDFMVHWSTGAWPDYNDSTVYIVSGKDGSILFEDRRPLYVMSSDLVIKSPDQHKDYFLVKMRGLPEGVGSISRSEAHGVGVQRNISKRAIEEGGEEGKGEEKEKEEEDVYEPSCKFMENEYRSNHVTCDEDLENFAEQVFLLNRDSGHNLTLVHRLVGEKLDYDVLPNAKADDCIRINPKSGRGRMCAAVLPETRTTDAITDVDNDGALDLIHVGILEGRLRDSRYGYLEMKFTTIISRTTINSAIDKTYKQSHGRVEFSPLISQPWLQYLGTRASSIYTND